MLEDLIQHAHDEIEALVRNEACDHRDHRCTAVLGKPKIVLQAHLVVALALDCFFDVIVDVEILIRLRIIDIIVNTVDNAEELFAALLQQPLQMFTVVFVLNFLGIGLADG